MGEQQTIIVPQISSFPGHEARARAIVRWLVQQQIIEERLSTCGGLGNRMAHAIGPGARRVVERPQLLPFERPINGLEIVGKRCIYTPTRDFLEEAGCAQCRQEIGEALFDSLEEWMPGHTDNFVCPECGHEDDINGFLFLQPCGFSNLAFVFNNWGAAGFRQDFLDEFAERLGYRVSRVLVDL
ncbi:sugar ABC transporter ATPase [Pseudomonas lalucatii]|uniref:Sugar ABC transporter ATPase n=1 Tax=Pseudomonas lalucatii TaxID=1424203 RepID=A0ABS5Q4F4_9PSED|nr:sugar ABC transporter ATPase [Pseudomonas lalucatii]MBS7663638.1 sugar ABC transporter ATPase [Pseudomonas lalucatii]